jgi:TrmH family RNA methyltransferase
MLLRALRAGVRLECALVAEVEADAELEAALEAAGTPMRTAPKAMLLEAGEGRASALAVGLATLKAEEPLEVLSRAPSGTGSRNRSVLVAWDIEEPGNVGALTRTALASGLCTMVCGGRTDPFHPKAVRTSMGSVFKLDFVRASSEQAVLGELSGAGIRALGAVVEGGTTIERLSSDPERPYALFVGNEGAGLPPSLANQLEKVSIVMASAVDSYSVNAATAILLYALGRRSTLEPSSESEPSSA